MRAAGRLSFLLPAGGRDRPRARDLLRRTAAPASARGSRRGRTRPRRRCGTGRPRPPTTSSRPSRRFCRRDGSLRLQTVHRGARTCNRSPEAARLRAASNEEKRTSGPAGAEAMVIAEERWIASNPRRPYFAASRPASTSRKSTTASRSQSRRNARDATPYPLFERSPARIRRLRVGPPAGGDDLRLVDPLPDGGRMGFLDVKLDQGARVEEKDHRRLSSTVSASGFPLIFTPRAPLGFPRGIRASPPSESRLRAMRSLVIGTRTATSRPRAVTTTSSPPRAISM